MWKMFGEFHVFYFLIYEACFAVRCLELNHNTTCTQQDINRKNWNCQNTFYCSNTIWIFIIKKKNILTRMPYALMFNFQSILAHISFSCDIGKWGITNDSMLNQDPSARGLPSGCVPKIFQQVEPSDRHLGFWSRSSVANDRMHLCTLFWWRQLNKKTTRAFY